MSDFSIELAAEKVIDKRTKEYFYEVLSSFINKNYRSAVVMLWSVVIADLLYKLQSLRDIYNDPVATSILEAILAKQLANPNSPEWEPYLLDEINSRTHLLEVADYQHLVNLQKLRHLSAHPVISSSNLLFSPNKETTRALIRNSLEAVLLKPPIFSKKIVNEFVQDIGSKKDLLPDMPALKQYLEAKYFKNLHISVEHELVKALWKFCFRISNQDTDLNRLINRRTLNLLYQRNPIGFREFIVHNTDSFSEVSPGGSPLEAFITFLSECPALYSALTDTAKVPISAYARSDINLFSRVQFISESLENHIAQLFSYDYAQLRELSDESWNALIEIGREGDLLQSVLDIGVKIYCNSGVFDTADSNFARFVQPVINYLDAERLRNLLSGIESNNQTYWRGRSRIDHALVDERIAAVGGIDKAKYPNFCGSLPQAD